MPSHRVVAREGALTERTRHTNALMPLPDVSTQVRLIAVQTIAVETLELLAISRVDAVLVVHLGGIPYVQHISRCYGCRQIARQGAIGILQIL